MGSVARGLLVIVLAGCGCSGPDASPWSGETRIGHNASAGPVSDGYPTLAVDGRGNAILVFVVDGVIWARRFDAGSGQWLSLQQIGDNAATRRPPHLAMDGDGNAIVAWGGLGLLARRFDAGPGWPAGWGPVETIAPAAADVQLFLDELDVTRDGHAVVAFERLPATSAVEEVWVAVREAGGGWQPPVELWDIGLPARRATIGVAHVGASLRVVTAWIESGADGRGQVVHSIAEHDLVTHQLQRLELAPLGPVHASDYGSVRLGMDDRGDVVAMITQQTSTGSRLLGYRHTDGRWSTDVLFDAVGHGNQIQYDLAVDASGRATVVWSNCDARPCEVRARSSINTAWRPVVTLGEDGLRPVAGQAPSGRAVALWVTAEGGSDAEVFATELDPTTGWSEARGLGATAPADWMTVAMGGNDTAVAAWVTGASGENVVQGSVYRP